MPPGSLDKECLFSLMESPLDLDCAEKAFSCRRVSFVPHPARTHPHHARTQVEQLYTRVFRPALAFPRPRKIAASSAPRSGPGRRKHGGRGSASSQEPGPHQPAPHPIPVHLPAAPPRDRSIGSLPHSLTHSLPSLPPAPSLPFCLPSSRSPAARGAPPHSAAGLPAGPSSGWTGPGAWSCPPLPRTSPRAACAPAHAQKSEKRRSQRPEPGSVHSRAAAAAAAAVAARLVGTSSCGDCS